MGTDVIRLRWRLSPPRRIWELDAAQPPVVPPMLLRSKPHMCVRAEQSHACLCTMGPGVNYEEFQAENELRQAVVFAQTPQLAGSTTSSWVGELAENLEWLKTKLHVVQGRNDRRLEAELMAAAASLAWPQSWMWVPGAEGERKELRRSADSHRSSLSSGVSSARWSQPLPSRSRKMIYRVKNHDCNKNNRTITLAANANARHSAPTPQPSFLLPTGGANTGGYR